MAVPTSLKERLVASLLGCLLFLLVLEVSLRILGIACEHRDPTAASTTKAGTGPTILCVGDSYTWGAGAPAHMSWPRQLERLLNSEGRSGYTVVNRGKGGQNSARLVQEFQYNLDTVKPSLVIILTGSANHWDAYGSDETPTKATWGQQARDLLYRVRVFRLAKLLYLNVQDIRAKAERARYLAGLEARRAAFEQGIEKAVPEEKRRRAQTCAEQGYRWFSGRNFTEATKCFREGMDANPYLQSNYVGLADCLDQQQKREEALVVCRKAIECNPFEIRAYVALANGLLNLHKPEEGEGWMQKARDLAPRDPLVLKTLARNLAQRQRYTEALECLQQAMEAGGSSMRHEILCEQAWIYQDMQDADKAVEVLRTALAEKPEDERSWGALGGLQRKLGKLGAAVESYQEAIKRNPQEYRHYRGLGECYQDLDRPSEALKAFEKAAELNPQQAAECLADAYRWARRESDAIHWYCVAIRLNPHLESEIRPKIVAPVSRPQRLRMPTAAETAPSEPALTETDRWVQADLLKVIAMCRKAGVPLLMQSYPTPTLTAALRQTAAENGIPFVDHLTVFRALQDPARYFAPDMHCNDLGYGLMARDLLPKVLESVTKAGTKK